MALTTSEHLKYGSHKVTEIMAHILNYIVAEKLISLTQKLGIVTSVHKKGKPPTNMISQTWVTDSKIFIKEKQDGPPPTKITQRGQIPSAQAQ